MRYRRRIPSIDSATDVRRKEARKKRQINHKVSLLFRGRADRTAVSGARRKRGTNRRRRTEEEEEEEGEEEGGSGREEAEYKVTSHVYFVPVDPIKVPIIISDVFRCNMFDLVSDIL